MLPLKRINLAWQIIFDESAAPYTKALTLYKLPEIYWQSRPSFLFRPELEYESLRSFPVRLFSILKISLFLSPP